MPLANSFKFWSLPPTGRSLLPFVQKVWRMQSQHMNYEASLRFKTNVVRESIRRIGGLENVVVHDTVGMEQPVNYRNKAQYPIGRYKDGIRADFTQKIA